MELMAPVGSKEALKAAITGGADAIYLGGKLFGARRLAENFTDVELGTGVKLAHKNGVKAYVTVNTLVKEGELDSVFSFLNYLDSIRVDGGKRHSRAVRDSVGRLRDRGERNLRS